MIQLANAPTDRRLDARPAANDARLSALEPVRGRTTHAWPFMCRRAATPASPVRLVRVHGGS